MTEHGTEPSLHDPANQDSVDPVQRSERQGPESPFVERQKRLQALPPGPAVKQAMAMCALDRDTDPNELSRKCRHTDAAAVQQVTQYLVFRAKTRAAWALQNQPFQPPQNQDERYLQVLSLIHI